MKHLSPYLYTIVFSALIALSSCENDMKDINRLANIQQEEAVDISKNVNITYSDSAKVKAIITGPEMRVYHDSTENSEFPKGVEIFFFDKQGKESQRIKADYAIQRTTKELTEFKKNVVVTMADGSVIKTEELFYDQKEERYYNTVPITFFFNDERGNMEATSFTSDTNFDRVEGENMTGFMIQIGNSAFPSF